MGTWDYTTFGNDDACDWGHDLGESDGLDFIEETLDAVIDAGDEYVEAPAAAVAIALATVPVGRWLTGSVVAS